MGLIIHTAGGARWGWSFGLLRRLLDLRYRVSTFGRKGHNLCGFHSLRQGEAIPRCVICLGCSRWILVWSVCFVATSLSSGFSVVRCSVEILKSSNIHAVCNTSGRVVTLVLCVQLYTQRTSKVDGAICMYLLVLYGFIMFYHPLRNYLLEVVPSTLMLMYTF